MVIAGAQYSAPDRNGDGTLSCFGFKTHSTLLRADFAEKSPSHVAERDLSRPLEMFSAELEFISEEKGRATPCWQ